MNDLQAENYRYSILTIENWSGSDVSYSYRWGREGEAIKNSIPSYSSCEHYQMFEYVNENRSPWFYVQIDGDSRWYELGSFFSTDTDMRKGKLYRIVYSEEEEGFILEERVYKE